jgi:hypothetical protein
MWPRKARLPAIGCPAALGSKDHLHQGVGRQRAIQLVKLLATGRGDGDGDAQVVAGATFTEFQSGGIEQGIKGRGDACDCGEQVVRFDAHDFDGKAAGVRDEAVMRQGCRVLRRGRHEASGYLWVHVCYIVQWFFGRVIARTQRSDRYRASQTFGLLRIIEG